jgi:CRISPR-associated protein Cas2
MFISGYRCMWVLAMFDLPTETKRARKNYARFRKSLLEDGFQQMQDSVYSRHCPSKENAEVHVERVRRNLPPDGEVRVITITDKQYERMLVFWGKKRTTPEKPPRQMELF